MKIFPFIAKSIWPGHVIFLFTFKHPAMFPPTMSIDCHWLKHKTLWDVEKQTNRWSDLVKTCLPVLQILHLLVFLFKELMSTLSKKIEKKERKVKKDKSAKSALSPRSLWTQIRFHAAQKNRRWKNNPHKILHHNADSNLHSAVLIPIFSRSNYILFNPTFTDCFF